MFYFIWICFKSSSDGLLTHKVPANKNKKYIKDKYRIVEGTSSAISLSKIFIVSSGFLLLGLTRAYATNPITNAPRPNPI